MFFQTLKSLLDYRAYVLDGLTVGALGGGIDLGLGAVYQRFNIGFLAVGIPEDFVGGYNQVPLYGLLAEKPGVALDMRRRADFPGKRCGKCLSR